MAENTNTKVEAVMPTDTQTEVKENSLSEYDFFAVEVTKIFRDPEW